MIYLVTNGGEYDWQVHAVFTDRTLADKFAEASKGHVEEWEENIPAERWQSWVGRLNAEKRNNVWTITVLDSWETGAITAGGPFSVSAMLGHYSAWAKPDSHGKYTHGYATSSGQSKAQVEKLCVDAFWKEVAEKDPS